MKFRSNQAGLGAVEIIITVVVVATIAGVGFVVLKADEKKAETNNSSSSSKSETETSSKTLKLAAEPYEDPATGLTVSYPEGWTITPNIDPVLVAFTNPEKDSENGKRFSANINVILEQTTASQEEYVVAAKTQVGAGLTNYKLVDERTVTVEGIKVTLISGTFEEQGLKLRNLQAIGVIDGVAIVQTSTALASTWERYAAIFEEASLN